MIVWPANQTTSLLLSKESLKVRASRAARREKAVRKVKGIKEEEEEEKEMRGCAKDE